ncbi:NADP-dependent oxidoreductase [Streptomyces sp. CA-210063]|uniref:NADP-dependent oxidoreductase n=1 Tax=Streptomyces sp. CA-210063 TaxID=2801029 RepID=UPI00214BD25A|nr:NADP-dependent oxidoreductase [Streptomyces sp. CA-210063]UUU36838.1 NADP-dependent oxidoreductase [Streptomyces sp. CA-210063]
MRTAVVTTFGGPEAVEIIETEIPEPATGQIRIKVAAAALNPVDAGARSGAYGEAGGRFALGWDVAGTVDAAGQDAHWKAGDEVVALAPGLFKPLGTGTHAEYLIVDADAAARAPKSWDTTLAATLPLNARTAAQCLDLLDLSPGQSLLVTGAAGAVGAYAVQLAVHQRIEVTALARETDEEYVRSLGAAHFTSTTAGPASVDAVLDTAILGDTALSWVRDGGAFVGLRFGAEPAPTRGIRPTSVGVIATDGPRLAALVALADKGVLTSRVAQTYPLAEAAKAHAHLAEGGVRGRLVLVP